MPQPLGTRRMFGQRIGGELTARNRTISLPRFFAEGLGAVSAGLVAFAALAALVVASLVTELTRHTLFGLEDRSASVAGTGEMLSELATGAALRAISNAGMRPDERLSASVAVLAAILQPLGAPFGKGRMILGQRHLQAELRPALFVVRIRAQLATELAAAFFERLSASRAIGPIDSLGTCPSGWPSCQVGRSAPICIKATDTTAAAAMSASRHDQSCNTRTRLKPYRQAPSNWKSDDVPV